MYKNKFKLAIICGMGCMLMASALNANTFEGTRMLTNVEMEAVYGGTGSDEACLSNDKGCDPPPLDSGCYWRKTMARCLGIKSTGCRQSQVNCRDTDTGSCTDKSAACTGRWTIWSCVLKNSVCVWGEALSFDCNGTKTDC